MPAAHEFITRPPQSLAGWVRLFDPAALPVLAGTARALEELRALEDAVDAHLLAEAIASDPLMTLKLLAHLARLRRGRDGSDTETVTEALVMLGIPPFFRAFGPQTASEDLLADRPQALAGFHAVLQRSHRAARFAVGFAVHRMDHDAPVIHEAALLHDFAELLLWLRAPALVLEIAHRQQAEPGLRSAALQREILHVELAAARVDVGLAPAVHAGAHHRRPCAHGDAAGTQRAAGDPRRAPQCPGLGQPGAARRR